MKKAREVGEKVALVRDALSRGIPPGVLRKNPWGLVAVTAVTAGVVDDEKLVSIIQEVVGSYNESRFVEFFSKGFETALVRVTFDKK